MVVKTAEGDSMAFKLKVWLHWLLWLLFLM